ncbi:serine/threonine-protein kinase [Actinophytocola glycyrrhizae]|uniref:non-specific serine/threonine protein kinase n=1 Tax=Actinophytocola glycyrrhizae TaxID=2044873 RepID=A0ABV9S617_9PSEU
MTQQPELTHRRVIAGRYAILDEIGRGGMGVVWLAEDRTIGRRVAIKELHLPAGVPTEERRVLEERVLREARAAGRLNDPGVVTVFDVLQEAGTTYIVMELIQAPTLSDIVARQGPLPQEAVARIAEQLLSALEAAHAAGVVHRDVKPSNIMVQANGRVKLTDFGIAQTTDDPRLTSSGVLLGSPTYLAPEVIRGQQADAGSDLWALGASLFFAVEGNAAFGRSSTAATMHAIISEVPYLTRGHGPLASAIMGLLNATPQARLSAQQVRGLLAQVGTPTGEHTVAHAATAMYPGPHATRLAPGPRPRRKVWPFVAVAALVLACAFAGGWFSGRAGLVEPVVDPAKGETFTYGDGGDIEEFEVRAGTCGGSPLQKGRSVPSSVGCDETHDFEVVYGSDLYQSDAMAYPGVERLAAVGEATCATAFNDPAYVLDEERAGLVYVTLIPSPAAWTDSENPVQSTLCAVRDADRRQLTAPVGPEE